jgi:hypothetical protein
MRQYGIARSEKREARSEKREARKEKGERRKEKGERRKENNQGGAGVIMSRPLRPEFT